MKKKILPFILAGVMILSSIPGQGISTVYANAPINSVQNIEANDLYDDMYNTEFTIVAKDLDGNPLHGERYVAVVVGLKGAIAYIFGSNTVFSASGLVYTIFKSGVATNVITFVKGAASNGGVIYTVKVGQTIYELLVK